MSDIHTSCERAWDGDAHWPMCQSCIDRLGRMDYLSGAGDR